MMPFRKETLTRIQTFAKVSTIFLLTILNFLSALSLSSFASDRTDKPEVFVNIGHTRETPLNSFALGQKNFVTSISRYNFDDKHMILIKIWDRYTSRLFRNKELKFKKEELTLLPEVFAFFSEDENFLFIVVDNKDEKKDMLISYDFKNDKIDIQTFIFSELFPQKTKFAKYFAFNIEDWKLFFSKFHYKPYLTYFLPFNGYDSSKVSVRFSRVSDLIENAEIAVKNSFKVIPVNLKIRSFPRPVLSPDEKIFLAESEDGNALILYDIEKDKLTKIKGVIPVYQEWILKGPCRDYAITYGYDIHKFIIWNLRNASLEQIGVQGANSLLKFCPYAVRNKEGEFIFTTEVESKNGELKLQVFKTNNMVLFDKKTGKELAQFILFTDGEWIVITPEGYYNASPNGEKHLNVRIGNNVYGIENYRGAFYRPDLVKLALSGESLEGYKTLSQGEVFFNEAINILNIATTRDDLKKVAEMFEKAKLLSPDWVDVYYNLGLIYENLDYYDKAIENFTEYLKYALKKKLPDAKSVSLVIERNKRKQELLENVKSKMVKGRWLLVKQIPSKIGAHFYPKFKIDKSGKMWVANPISKFEDRELFPTAEPLPATRKRNIREHPWFPVEFDGRFFEIRGVEIVPTGSYENPIYFFMIYFMFKGEIALNSSPPMIIIREFSSGTKLVVDEKYSSFEEANSRGFQRLKEFKFDEIKDFSRELHYHIE